ncbi:aromatic acid exporter family protein [Streptomyces sp. YIM 98790]|uniref:FUSC family protein n=1 Tax=Streptomyces sp. YIM 98790 TaxID=2689077 RepID=UPI001408645B|nr:FUSC family protein [Streptomyces sp. YIM 98790]
MWAWLFRLYRLLHLYRVVRRVAGRARRAAARLRTYGPSVLLAALAAGLAYAAASRLFGIEEAFFAPIAAVVCVGIAAGQRIRRALEMAVGVAVGLTAADILVNVIGSGAVQLAVAVGLAMGAAVLVGTSSVLVNQSAVAAVLVVALAPQGSNPLIRMGDALIGGGVALALGALAAPDPRRAVRRAGGDVLGHLAQVLRGLAEALEQADLARAERMTAEAARIESRIGELDKALAVARESARLGRRRRSAQARLPVVLVRDRLDMMAATTRALARGTAVAVRYGQPVDQRLVTALDSLAVAVTELRRRVQGEGTQAREDARAAALRAAGAASELLAEDPPLTASVLVGQVRAAAVDVLRATGLDQAHAVRRLVEAAGPPNRPPAG